MKHKTTDPQTLQPGDVIMMGNKIAEVIRPAGPMDRFGKSEFGYIFPAERIPRNSGRVNSVRLIQRSTR